ncbi:uncharacterized protein FA14DRAFT_121652 [Meira miltonrushii]|uniref:PLD phosphodiesterase domain-containing protein n=1 Tax=Meira miltonrushii TaxID=1280837 RepID=A0A316VCV4_9BASI|nr:uncharacterized protein FA14DRAFT_121652 [Meira miltonrushii]PWN35392.1 hypothetical protein FA14DRAFT_121652 [Meira miltonrushii]
MSCFPKTKATQQSAKEKSAASSSTLPQSEHPTITSAVAADPTLPPSKAATRLFPNPPAWKRGILRFKIKEQLEEGRGKKWNWHKGAVHVGNQEPDEKELQSIRERFGYSSDPEKGPSKLYLMMLADACLPLPRNPMSGVVSPSLLATTGIVPFSVFSTGPDIIQHYYDCIVAAQKEVVCLTNYWQLGKNVDRISDALRELNKRHQKRKEERTTQDSNGNSESESSKKQLRAKDVKLEDKIIVKLMWDRGPQTLADLFRIRKPVPPELWKKNGLPTEDEIPYLSVEILNYHRPLMGTFHAKLLLVDRQVAVINSNNIQDRPNLEACTRLEGDIVNSVYDHALISWGNRLNPPLPCLGSPAPKTPSPSAFSGGEESTLPHITAARLREIASSVRERLRSDDEEAEVEQARPPIRRMSFADVMDGVMRRDGTMHSPTQTHAPKTPRFGPSTPKFGPSSPQKDKQQGSPNIDREQAARNAGAEWARKALRLSDFQETHSQPAQGSQSADQALTPNRRHFADVVYALMEKEGIKPGLWAEGALDAFGLGPSSSRNVADEARKSRNAAKTAAEKGISIPQMVKEEDGKSDGHVAGGDDTLNEVGAGSPDAKAVSPQHTTETASNVPATITKQSSPSQSTSNLEVPKAGNSANGDANLTPTDPTLDEAPEAAPGSKAYQRRKRTISSRSRASASERLAQITKSLDFANLSQVKGEITAQQLAAMTDRVAQEIGGSFAQGAVDILDFNPYIFHLPHSPVPMALVNRRPHGTPGHSDIRNAQDAAWLAGFRYAKEHIFLQSPTLNATPIKHAVLHAVRRHVRVELWLGLGFNDKSESMPFQGGTNENVVTRLYRQLRREGKGDEKYLEVYWYTGKDMARPLNAVRKQRNCHVKYVSFDGEVAIIGSGNQDTQSWYHSQEINVMVDSRQIVGEWDRALRRNQSTHLYGRVDDDGIWRGRTGAETVDKGGD